MEYLLVTYHEERDLLIDDIDAGLTNHIMRLSAGRYTLSLGGAANFEPNRMTIVLRDTTELTPLEVIFE